MDFVVQAKPGQGKKRRKYPYVVLVPDNWDDYGYKSSFEATLHVSAGDSVELGTVKIIKEGQDGGYTKLPNSFEALGEGYCSLGQHMDYYKELLKRGQQIYRPLLTGLGDAAFDEKVRYKFEEMVGFQVSLTRFAGDIVTKAHALFQGTRPRQRSTEKGFEVNFRTRIAPESDSLDITFDFGKHGELPHRFNALIGYNGTGKTKLLSNLAIVASGYGYMTKQEAMKQAAGRFRDPLPPFEAVVVVSYSAFDTFVIPGRTGVERQRLARDGGIFGYVYCGLREKAGESTKKNEVYRLKTPQEVQTEFLSALSRVREREREGALLEILGPVMLDPSFKRIGLESWHLTSEAADVAELFSGLSSGHKVVIKMLVELTGAYVRQ